MISYLNLPEIFYLGVYQPSTGECEGDFDLTEYTSRIWDLKKCDLSVIDDFAKCISSNIQNNFDGIVVVPPHCCGKDNFGIQILSKQISEKKKLHDATSCLIRHKNIDKLSSGGDRSIHTHLQSIKVVNQKIIEGKNLLLLDDVSTTGNSLMACQKLLESAGAKTVKSFVLGKTTRYQEELGFFNWQYDVITQNIQEELEHLQEELYEENELNHARLEYEDEIQAQILLETLDYDNLQGEDFDEQDCGLAQDCYESHQEIDYQTTERSQLICYEAECQIQSLNNLYEFSLS
jgi:hypoxanthine phosphoribosyltransferase